MTIEGLEAVKMGVSKEERGDERERGSDSGLPGVVKSSPCRPRSTLTPYVFSPSASVIVLLLAFGFSAKPPGRLKLPSIGPPPVPVPPVLAEPSSDPERPVVDPELELEAAVSSLRP